MSKCFSASRADGRSDARVVVDLVAGAVPGTTFEFEVIESALAEGLPADIEISRSRVGAAARNANRALLKNAKRMLAPVRGVGYRLALATEHRALATRRELAADRQLQRGLTILKNVNWDEMDEMNRTAHLAHLQVSEAIAMATHRVARQQRRQDEVLNSLLKRVGTLETAVQG